MIAGFELLVPAISPSSMIKEEVDAGVQAHFRCRQPAIQRSERERSEGE
jgi:hypothetical protein